jgi:hypothetical protein
MKKNSFRTSSGVNTFSQQFSFVSSRQQPCSAGGRALSSLLRDHAQLGKTTLFEELAERLLFSNVFKDQIKSPLDATLLATLSSAAFGDGKCNQYYVL